MMNRYLSLVILLAASVTTLAQNRQHIGGFSQFKHYFNPALTGNDGTSIKNFYRDQMTSFDDAPKTLFLSGEANLADLKDKQSDGLKHGFGLSMLYDSFGATKLTRANFAYSATIKITEDLSLSSGISATYTNMKIDPNQLLLVDQTDDAYFALLNGNNSQHKFGGNIGIALSSNNFYVGYALNNAIESSKNNAYLNDLDLIQHAAQVGYRYAVSNEFGLIFNGMYRYDEMKSIAEGQLKFAFLNTFWVGGGYRQDIAYTFTTGVRFKQFQVGYTRELSVNKIAGTYSGGNEVVLSFHLAPLFGKAKKVLDLW